MTSSEVAYLGVSLCSLRNSPAESTWLLGVELSLRSLYLQLGGVSILVNSKLVVNGLRTYTDRNWCFGVMESPSY